MWVRSLQAQRCVKAFAKWMGIVMLAVLGLVAAVVVFFITPPGERILKAFVVERANETLGGELAVGDLDLSLRSLTLHDVVLRDPSGDPVAQAARMHAAFSWLPLLQGRLVLRQVEVTAPALQLRKTQAAWNLERALATQPKSDTGAELPTVVVENFSLSGGTIDVRQADQHHRVEQFRINARGRYAEGEASSWGEGDLSGEVQSPVQAPLKVSMEGKQASDGAINARSEMRLGQSHAAFVFFRQPNGQWALHVPHLQVHPHEAQAYLPQYPLRVEVLAQAQVESPRSEAFQGNVIATAGDASLSAEGSVDLKRMRADGVDLRVQDLDFSQIIAGMPKSDVSLTAQAQVEGNDWQSLRGKVSLHMPASRVGDVTVGPASIEASADGNGYVLDPLNIVLPGVRLRASGAGPKDQIAVSGRLSVSDLNKIENLARLFGVDIQNLEGRGQLRFALEGPPRQLTLSATGGFPLLAWNESRVMGLRLGADVSHLDAAIGVVNVQAQRVKFGDTTLRQIQATAEHQQDGDLRAHASIGGSMPLRVAVAGDLSLRAQRLLLSRFQLKYPRTTWRLQDTATIAWSDSVINVDGLALQTANRAFITLDAVVAQQLKADVRLRDVSAAVIPKWLAKGVPVGGTLNGDVKLSGSMEAPRVAWNLAVWNGRYARLNGIAVKSQGRFQNGQVAGDASVRWREAKASAKFAAPINAFTANGAMNVSGHLTVGDLAALSRSLPLDAKVPALRRGELQGSFEATGTLARPDVKLELEAHDVAFATPQGQPRLPAIPLLGVHAAHEGSTSRVRISLQAAGGHAVVTARLEGAVNAALSGGSGALAALKRVPVVGQMDMVDLDLGFVPVALLPVDALEGSVSGNAQLSGQLGDPKVEGTLIWEDGFVIVPAAEATQDADGAIGRRSIGKPTASPWADPQGPAAAMGS